MPEPVAGPGQAVVKVKSVALNHLDIWVRRGRPGPAVVWLRVGNTSRRALLDWFTPLLPAILRDLQEGERLVEVR
jgi:predicted nuclease of predicted toxin-antitoxin system